MPSAHRYAQRSLPRGARFQASYSLIQHAFSLETTAADRPAASLPTSAASASPMLPVETPFRYNHGSTASTLLERRTYRGTSEDRNRTPSPERSLLRGIVTGTGPIALKTSRSGR